MPLPRRLLLAATALLVPRPAVAAPPQRGHAARLTLDPDDPEKVSFGGDGVVGSVTLPQARVRIAALLPIAGRELAAIAFAADRLGTTVDLLALIGWDGLCLRILGLEVLSLSAPDGTSLSSRFAGVGDHSRISITRTAAIPRAGRPKRWENWIDLLAWRNLAPLADAPVRAALLGTRQAEFAAIRAKVIAGLSPPCQAITPELLAPFASLSPPMPRRRDG